MTNDRELASEALPTYELADELGRGGWGVVYAAQHRTLGRPVAVKMLPRAFGADPDVRSRFLDEARVVASLDHPHIVPLFDFVEHEGLCLLVMEHMPGGTLLDRVERDGALDTATACAVSLATLAALSHAHARGVLHRDIKPENVLFGATGVPKLADFGIAKVVGGATEKRTATGVIMGTPAYMAPEQVVGDPMGPRTDVYAMGVMLYELLSGTLPFASTGDPITQLFRHVHEDPRPLAETAPGVDPALAAVVARALEKSPDDRYPDAATFARALDDAACKVLGPNWLADSDVTVLATRNELAAARNDNTASHDDDVAASAGGDEVTGHHRGPGNTPGAAPTPGRTDPTMLGTAPPPVASPPSTPPAPAATTPPSAPSGPAAASPSVPPTPATAPPPAVPAISPGGAPPATSPPPAHSPPPRPDQGGGGAGLPDAASTPSQEQSRRPAALVGVGLFVLVIAAVAAFLVLGGGGDSEQAAAPTTDASVAAVTVAEADDFTDRCEEFLSPELCDCGLERMLEDLEPEQFRANLDLMERTQGAEQGTEVLVRVQELLAACVEEIDDAGA